MGNLHLFIRHPDDVPIKLNPLELSEPDDHPPRLGLICSSHERFPKGSTLGISFPSLTLPPHQLVGRVFNCLPTQQSYELAIEFSSADSAMQLRMIEQQAYIRLYQQYMSEHLDRQLSEEAAALEWIDRYAAYFPSHNR